MKPSIIKSAMLSLFLFAGAAIGGAQTVTVGPTGQYPTPCAAFPHLTDGETVQIDANGGTPYNDSTDCNINNNNLTLVGVNGRAVMDGSGLYTSKGLWIMNGHDNVVDNIEFGNASGQQNAAGIRIQIDNGGSGGSNGGNITIQHSYVHNNGTGILGANSDGVTNWFSANPYIMFQYDEFSRNGNLDGQGNTHNFYMGYGGNMDFTLQYSWTHDSYVGHTIKTRAPFNNILYDLITSGEGNTSYLLNFPLGGSNYIVGNSIFKAAVVNSNANQNWFLYRDVGEDIDGGDYPPVHQDLHFINNTVINDAANTYPSQFISLACGNSDINTCPPPNNGGAIQSVNAVIENNIFMGPAGNAVSNQGTAHQSNNVMLTYSTSALSSNFVDALHYDYHLVSGSPAIQAGLYPPTDNTGATDPKALAVYEHINPAEMVARPTPTGSHMDAGAYSYPRVHAIPTGLNLSYTNTVTVPGSGTITITGLPTPASGHYNTATFFSENSSVIGTIPSAASTTGTITTKFQALPTVTTTTVVPIDIYVQDAHLTANITVNPGPPTLTSITLAGTYTPYSSVNLAGPAPAGGTVIQLSSSDQSILYAPSSVTVPQGQISVSTGSNTGSLWTNNPSTKNATITATQGSIQKSLTITVFAPAIHSTQAEFTSVQGGQPLLWHITMVGFFPNAGGSFVFTSSNPALIPNQTIAAPAGNYNADVSIATNASSTGGTANLTLNLNGDTTNGNGQSNTTAITVTATPATPGAASNLTATASGARPINLSWTASSTSGVSYNLYRSTTSGFTASASNQVGSGITGTTFADYSLLPSTTYYYVIKANNAGVLSAASNQASAATQAGVASGATDVIAINAGGSAASPYVSDVDFTAGGGGADTITNTIDTSLVTNPAPQAVYQSERYGAATYTIPGLTVGQSYVVRLHFAELWNTDRGSRVFGVTINGNTALSNFDILATAGAQYKAVALNFAATANASGQIIIQLTNGSSDSPKINGLEIQTASGGGGGDVIAINASGAVAGSYVADTDFVGGSTSSTGNTVDTSAVTNPAPQAVYQTQRYGNSTYTIPGLTSGSNYTVLLHFAETYWSGVGQRVFNVGINGTQVLTNFDIRAAAGASNKAIIKTFSATANGSGQIVIQFTTVTDNAAINGIEIQAGAANTPASIAVVSGSGQSANTGSNFTNPLVVVVKNASGTGVSGATVTFAGSGISFPSGATAITNGSGQAQVTAHPTTTGAHTVTASVSGVGTPASFTETGTSPVALSSITLDSPYQSGTTVHLTGAAPAGGAVVSLSTSNSSIEYVPATVTVPAGATTAETGSLMGSLWGQSPFNRSVTVTGVYAGVTKTLTASIPTAILHAFSPNGSVKGGQQLAFYMETAFNAAPFGGGLYTISSDHSTIIPNQSFTLPAGQVNDFGKFMNTNTVATTTTVNVTLTYNGTAQTTAVSVTP